MKLLLIISALLFTADESAVKSRRVLMFTAPKCGPCNTAKREIEEWMRPSGWKFGDTADCHVQYVQRDKLDESGKPIEDQDGLYVPTELAKRFKVESVPCWILISDGREIERVVGYQVNGTSLESRRQVVVNLFGRSSK